MQNMNFEEMLKEYARRTEEYLAACYTDGDSDLRKIVDAEKYSLLSGGKRIRAYLVFAFCEMLGKSEKEAAPFACAVEMVHAYSLIHDDLPCMDDDDYRRGKPTSHKVFGEATAVLAGDALLTKAFEVAAGNRGVSSECVLEAVISLAKAAGDMGMVGGQILDLDAENTPDGDIDKLRKIHLLKTGAMIKVSARLGCLAAGMCDGDVMRDAEAYAEKIGVAFQIVDDVLDVVGDSAVLGKNIGSDENNQKLTYMSFYTPDEAMALARTLTDEAIAIISKYKGSERLVAFAEYLLNRNH